MRYFRCFRALREFPMTGFRPLALIAASGLLAGCGENVDLLYYPEGADRREVRVVRDLPSFQACERRAREIADALSEARRARAEFECGLGAHDHPNFGRRYEERVEPAIEFESEARDRSAPEPQRRLDLSGAAFADEAEPAVRRSGPWQVQLASFRDTAAARDHALDFIARNEELVADRPLRIFATDLGDAGVYHRVRLTGFADSGEARRTCESLRAGGLDCFVARAAQAG
jgi:hypothetical protein